MLILMVIKSCFKKSTYENVMNSNISYDIEQVRFENTNQRLPDRKFRKHVLHNHDNLKFN